MVGSNWRVTNYPSTKRTEKATLHQEGGKTLMNGATEKERNG